MFASIGIKSNMRQTHLLNFQTGRFLAENELWLHYVKAERARLLGLGQAWEPQNWAGLSKSQIQISQAFILNQHRWLSNLVSSLKNSFWAWALFLISRNSSKLNDGMSLSFQARASAQSTSKLDHFHMTTTTTTMTTTMTTTTTTIMTTATTTTMWNGTIQVV